MPSQESSPPVPATAQESLISAINQGTLQEVVNIVTTHSVDLNAPDENGMSPLQHAAYKGSLPMVKYLLEEGAEVNQLNKERYTPLMFAAIGGHTAVVSHLLEHDANATTINSVGRNASQMAAFVGQHRSVALINNFIPRSIIEYYSRPTGLETTPRLSIRFIAPLLAYVRLVNINPIRIAFFLKANLCLFEEPKMISNVLELLTEKLMRSSDPKEMLSLKVHYLAFIYGQIQKAFTQSKTILVRKEDGTLCRESAEAVLGVLVKLWLKHNEKGFPEILERLLRQSVRSYPFQESVLFQQLVHTLSTVEIGDEPSALGILSQAILGKGPADDTAVCFTCGELAPDKRCSKCKVATYCDAHCQKMHWPMHKLTCEQLGRQYRRNQEEAAEIEKENQAAKKATQEKEETVKKETQEKEETQKKEVNDQGADQAGDSNETSTAKELSN